MSVIEQFPSFISLDLESRVKLAYAQHKSDKEIAEQEGIPVTMVERLMERNRLPIGIQVINGLLIEKTLVNGKWVETNRWDPSELHETKTK